jgi:hypothetical protein
LASGLLMALWYELGVWMAADMISVVAKVQKSLLKMALLGRRVLSGGLRGDGHSRGRCNLTGCCGLWWCGQCC